MAQNVVTITGVVSVMHATKGPSDSRDAAVWVTPVASSGERGRSGDMVAHPRMRILQRNKQFEPHLLVVPVGTTVDFPNADPFFHNVFSMFDGKRFDLGLYEEGTTRSVDFSHPGVCFLFCNIHPEMSGVVVVVDSPYYAVTNRAGAFTIANVPPGRYTLSVWHERGKPERPDEFPRDLTVSQATASLGTIRLVESGQVFPPHKNKYGRDYGPPPPAHPLYK